MSNWIAIIATFALLIITVYAMKKKLNTTLVLYLFSIIALTAVWTVRPLEGDAIITGNAFFDALETTAAQMYSYMKIVGMTLMPVLGFSVYATHIKASPLMVRLVATPLKRLKNPYMLGMFFGLLISGLLRMAVPTASPIAALLLGSLYPVMVSIGISKASAAAVILMGVSFDWSPADSSSVYAVNLATGKAFGTDTVSVSQYFTDYQLLVVPVAILVSAFVMIFTNRYFDKKQNLLNKVDIKVEEDQIDLTGIPKFYAILPLLPLVFLLGFSWMGIDLTYGPFAASMISLAISLTMEAFRLKSFKAAFNDAGKFVSGMGSGIGTVLYAGGSGAFAQALGTLGGIMLLYNMLSGLGGWPIFIIIMLFSMLLGFATGGVSTALLGFSPLMPNIASAVGTSLWGILMPFQILTGHGRAISPLGPPAIMISGITGVDVLELNKRCLIPVIASVLTTLVTACLIFG